jgi:diadenosine tetraphosphate (Ap4A) HIT family hydrolase
MVRCDSAAFRSLPALPDFALDPQLKADTSPVTRLGLSELLLMNDARFPWLILVPRRAGMTEIIDLTPADRDALFAEIVTVSEALRSVTACDKLNVAALGNQTPQLHVHVIARFRGDAAWPGPVWGKGAAVAYDGAARDRLTGRITERLTA